MLVFFWKAKANHDFAASSPRSYGNANPPNALSREVPCKFFKGWPAFNSEPRFVDSVGKEFLRLSLCDLSSPDLANEQKRKEII
ncbi:MAG: hypothetical protein A2428_13270 [Bdellovibrionales bacterium RIFOXYC1_FULL_54_43]|nr:MAG: hypothetical protein A2428_13270 [Bdellovibrionales bacterium RIFOXYC1_FULL_54_43]OFZ83484.1 MAG: hypothetical protein A2603_12255 [Bdellovibrionales bacterium RIFOXYD1_FULL_55_31]